MLCNPIEDDFSPSSPEVFQQGMDFALKSLDQPGTKVFCPLRGRSASRPDDASGNSCSLSRKLEDAFRIIEAKRPVVDFADVYVDR